jgi:hypothetical protein
MLSEPERLVGAEKHASELPRYVIGKARVTAGVSQRHKTFKGQNWLQERFANDCAFFLK